jgi:two-component system response regulator ChvI
MTAPLSAAGVRLAQSAGILDERQPDGLIFRTPCAHFLERLARAGRRRGHMSLVVDAGSQAGLAAGAATPVALVDDDDLYRETLAAELGDHGFKVHAFADGEACLAALEQGLEAALVLLDWTLPRLQGVEVLALLLAKDRNRPVIILTGRAPVERELDALQGGAIDFVDKARGVAVLVPRVRLLVPSDIVPPGPEPVVCGALLLQPHKGRAEWRGRDIGLTVVEQRIVALLVANGGQPMTYRAIYDQVHYAGFVAGDGERGFERNVRTMIKRLRRKFRAIDPGFQAVRSIAGLGYSWDASDILQ